MRITRVWNPFFEFPYTLQILQKKVRYCVTWGYEKSQAAEPGLFVFMIERSFGLAERGYCYRAERDAIYL